MSESKTISFEPVAPLLSENAPSGDAFASLLDPEMTSRAVAQLAAMEKMLNALTQGISFKEFTREILLAFMAAVPCEAGSILERDTTTEEFFFRVAAGQVSDRIKAFRVPKVEGVVWHVAESKQTCLIDAAHSNEKHLSWMSKSLGFDMRAMIALPILIRGQTFCVLELINRVGESSFSTSDQTLLEALAQAASKFIETRLMLQAIAEGHPETARRAA